MIKVKWLIYTVFIGLIPFLLRFFYYLSIRKLGIDYIFNEADMVTFGFVLNVTNINELSDKTMDLQWKIINIGVSVIFIIIFSTFLGISYFKEIDTSNLFTPNTVKIELGTLSIISFLISFSIYTYLNKLQNA